MPKEVMVVGLTLATGSVTHLETGERASLLDADVVIFRPTFGEVAATELYAGRPCFSERGSVVARGALTHWNRELHDFVTSGRNAFIFLNEPVECWAYTGKSEYSGSGRSRVTTNIVSPINTYEAIPAKLMSVVSSGRSMKLAALGADILRQYWDQFEKLSAYKVVIGSDVTPMLTTKVGSKVVGGVVRHPSGGAYVLLPSLDFDADDFVTSTGKWSARALRFAERFVPTILSIDSSLRSIGQPTAAPIWASEPAFELREEQRLRSEILALETQLEKIAKRKAAAEVGMHDAIELRSLLFETGKPLERAILRALRALGFKANGYANGATEFDAVFESEIGRFLGEAEGRDNKPITIDKLRQLLMNLHEDFAREDTVGRAKGVLFGNAHRLVPPSERTSFFSEKCVDMASSMGLALVATPELFHVARYVEESGDREFAALCQRKLADTVGIVTFPPIPK